MKVQQIRQAVHCELPEDWGTAGLPGTEPSRVTGRQVVIPGLEAVDTGVFECSAGTYRRVVKEAEVMHFIAGSGSFTPDGEETVHFASGDTLFFEANTQGLWEVREAMRKIYVIF
ncbi:cupin domain-containing protein [Paraburkholderia sp.]|uniref:cupin domain-containing protein n=1 Tax=Paraburkholderia sp. TaxID=1926495 RepID=UPI0023A518F8|nr:cupin domain-containing protein [Paraburkholderia sp.]MDE1180882.1 cupin domain-containing protein [Paraburkholderia sp.]